MDVTVTTDNNYLILNHDTSQGEELTYYNLNGLKDNQMMMFTTREKKSIKDGEKWLVSEQDSKLFACSKSTKEKYEYMKNDVQELEWEKTMDGEVLIYEANMDPYKLRYTFIKNTNTLMTTTIKNGEVTARNADKIERIHKDFYLITGDDSSGEFHSYICEITNDGMYILNNMEGLRLSDNYSATRVYVTKQ
ncbi:hypothetical protein PT162_00195 [Erysipelothrix rhusiopathiae]|nr:hypothetical protein [Erysipelothrix rhusiopathiae]